MNSYLGLFFSLQPAFETCIMNKLNTSSALADLEQRIVQIVFCIPAESTLRGIIALNAFYFFNFVLFFVFVNFVLLVILLLFQRVPLQLITRSLSNSFNFGRYNPLNALDAVRIGARGKMVCKNVL